MDRPPTRPHSLAARVSLILAMTAAMAPLLSAQSPFRIAESRLIGTETVELSINVPDAAATYALEFSGNPGTLPWQRIYDSLTEKSPEDPTRLFMRTRAAASSNGYFRIAQWPGLSVQVVLNELMPNNTETLADEDGEFVDWVELHNRSGAPVSLATFGLSDDPAQPLKWTFANGTTLAAHGYLIVHLSGKDRPGTDAETNPHTSFRLSNGRESLLFSNPSGIVLDLIFPGSLRSDYSLGRNVESPLDWHTFDGTPAATPGAANIPDGGTLSAPYIQPPAFTTAPGFHQGEIILTLQPHHPADVIYYTTDGSKPDPETSPQATDAMQIQSTTVMRAIAVTADGTSSEPSTATYFIDTSHTLPVISISADPDNFEIRDGYLYGFGDQLFSGNGRIRGNYPWTNSNAWQNREIDANIEMFEDDKEIAFNDVLGLKIFGGWGSRGYAQKSFAVFARSRRGTGRIQHQLFPDKDIPSFESFVLRNSGNDNQSSHLCVPRSEIRAFSTPASNGNYFVNGNFTLFRDAMLTSLSRDIGLDTQGYRPSVVYINGDYWGIYNIREKLNEHYVESNHGVPEDQVDLIEGYGSANSGSGREYSRMRSYISSRDLSDEEHYQFVQNNYLHLDNFIDYHLSVIFFQNLDIGNIKCWRPQVDGGKFRWIVYDQDYGFNLWKPDVYLPAMKRNFADYENMFSFYTNPSGSGTGWPNAGGRTILLRKMLDNDQFKERFILRCADLLNSTFSADYVTTRIDALAAPIRDEIPNHLARWDWAGLEKRGFGEPYKPEDEPFTQALWESHVQVMRDFAADRPAKLRNDLIAHFRLEMETGEVRVAVDPAEAGSVLVHTIAVNGSDAAPWSGTYFEDFPPPLAPLGKPGWKLASWSGDITEAEDGVTRAAVSAEAASMVTAHFEKAVLDPAHSAVAISEIHYHPADQQPGNEWVEIWNTGAADINISQWKLYDENDTNVFTLPAESTLAAGARLVLAADVEAFATAYPETTNVIGDWNFRLSNGGDSVRLVDSLGAIVEAVVFDDKDPWPPSADGGGYSLVRKLPVESPGAATSWEASQEIGGTPGQ